MLSTIDPRTLRGRLTLSFTIALLIGLCTFAACALILLREMERASLDQQFAAAATATLGIVDDHGQSVSLEDSDRRQFRDILGLRLNGAIYTPDGTMIAGNVADVPPLIVTAAHGPSGIVTVGAGEERVRADVVPVEHHARRIGTIVLWRPLEWFAGLDRSALLASAAIIGLITIPALVTGGLLVNRGLRPLEQIADIASEIEAHDLALRLTDVPHPRDELGRLSVTFNRMLDRLQAAFERERRFTADASHELRAPLAVIAAEASLALRRDRDAESYRASLAIVSEGTAELQTLIDDLLAAARIDDGPHIRMPTELASAARAAVALLAPLARTKGIALRTALDTSAIVRADAAALGRAVLAVVHNALKFTPEGGSVDLTVRRTACEALFRVEDDGPGFSQDALAHALDRFWRADPARSPGSGAGLGLAIARAVVERNGGSIVLSNAAATGKAIVEIRLPLADIGSTSSRR